MGFIEFNTKDSKETAYKQKDDGIEIDGRALYLDVLTGDRNRTGGRGGFGGRGGGRGRGGFGGRGGRGGRGGGFGGSRGPCKLRLIIKNNILCNNHGCQKTWDPGI